MWRWPRVRTSSASTTATSIRLSRTLTPAETLRKLIPADKTVVAESAIKNRADIEYLMKAGINAFLIGEGLVTAPDIGKKLRAFLGEVQE